MSKQLDVSSTEGCTSKPSSPKRRVLRYVVAIVVLSLAGFVIVIAPSQIRRELVIRNESSETLTITKAAYAVYNQKGEVLDGELGTDLVLLPKTAVRLPIRVTERGGSEITLADGRTLKFSLIFGWGESDVFIYYGPNLYTCAGEDSSLRKWTTTTATKLPFLMRLLY